MNYNLSVNLAAIPGASIQQSPTTGKLAVVLPIEECDIFLKGDGKAYLNLNIWANRSGKTQYGDTHYVKQALSKARREALGEAAKNTPIIGNMKEKEEFGAQQMQTYPQTTPQSYNPNRPDDTPF